MPKKSTLPANVTEFKDRHDNWHLRFRKKGYETYYFKGKVGTDEFREEYRACLDKKPMKRTVRTTMRTKPGSMSALIAIYYSSPEFTGLADSTRTTYRGILERFRMEYGELPVAALDRQSIKEILGGMRETPSAANNLLDRLRALMTYAMDDGWRHDDPTYRVRGFKTTGEGFHTWTEAEIEKFKQRHPLGTKARLALVLMLSTGQRRSDAVKMGRQHLEGNRIRVRQQKTDAFLSIPQHPDLAEAIAAVPAENMTFLLTEYGKPFSAAGFGNWFRDRCDEAEVKNCAAHGLRKAAARRLAEAGCSNQQIKAITGHKTDKEVARYTEAADQISLSDQAMAAFIRSESERKNG